MSEQPCCFTDDSCASCPARRMSDLPMCQRHMMYTFRRALMDGMLPADVFSALVRQTDALIELKQVGRRFEANHAWDEARRQMRAERQRIADERANQTFVYYVRLTGGRIKIGWTTNLEQRLQSYRSTADDLLATEPGGRSEEAKRHRQFAHLRIGRSEDFNESPELLAHIERLRHAMPKPA